MHTHANGDECETNALSKNIAASVLCNITMERLSLFFILAARSNRDWPPKKPRREGKTRTRTGICPY